MSAPAKTTLKSVDWFPQPPAAEREGVAGALVKLAIGVLAGAVFLALGARTMAIVVWVIAVAIGLVSLSSSRGRSGVSRFFGAVGFYVGRALTLILLVPVYLIGFTTGRMLSRLAGRDPLHLRDSDRPTFWLPCDRDARKVRHIRSMYTTEAPVAGGRRLLPVVAGFLVMVVMAEVLLRFMGFGNPVLYRVDGAIGYYPRPNQEVRRSGGRVVINEFGMRSPPVTTPKPDGELRILMLGDSTLYGGSYIDQEELYSSRLATLLQERAGGRPIEVLNVGVNGWGPFHKMGYISKFGTFDADIAVVCLPYGDVYRSLGGIEGKPFLPERAPPRLALQEVIHHLLWRVQMMTIGPMSPADQDHHARLGIKAYADLCRALRDAGCEVFVEVLPSESASCTDSVPADEARRVAELSQALEQAGFQVDYPARMFNGTKVEGELYHDECHLHREGHRLYADYLGDRIARTSERFKAWSGSPTNGAAPGAGGS